MANFLVSVVGVFIFLFIFWKRLKEDYASEIIFKGAFFILIGLLIGFLVSVKFFPGGIFWAGFLGSMIGLAAATLRLKIRPYETLEAAIIGLAPYLSLFFLSDSVANSSLISFIGFLVVLGLIFLYYYLDVHYKGFGWYKSGRVGFSGLTTLAVFFLIRCAIAIFFTSVLSFMGKSDVFISGALAFICFLLVFNLARS